MPTSQKNKRKKITSDEGSDVASLAETEDSGGDNHVLKAPSSYISPTKPIASSFTEPRDQIFPIPIGRHGLIVIFICRSARNPKEYGFWPYVIGLAKNSFPKYEVS